MKLNLHTLQSLKKPFIACLGAIFIFTLLIMVEIYSGFIIYTKNNASQQALHAQQSSIPKALSYKMLFNTAFFGDYVPNDLNSANIRRSLLHVEIVGILFASDEQESQVIIRTAGGNERTFNVGDEIADNAIIKRITPNGVLVQRSGMLESLSLPKSDLKFEPPSKPLKALDR